MRKTASFLLCLTTTLLSFSTHAQKPVLTVYTYESFVSEWGPGPAIEKNFEAICGCDLNFVGLDSSIGMLGRVKIEGASSKADIMLGLDTNLIEVARKTGLFAPHQSTQQPDALPVSVTDPIFMPFDWGYFAFVYDKNRLTNPPTSLDQLIESRPDLKIVIQDPRTATPGLGLLLWMKSVYGNQAKTKWKKLQPNIVTVTKGWWGAYSLFLEGEADMVLSYSTSPAYHQIAEDKDNFAAARFSEGHYVQIEVAAMLKNAPQPELARQFMDFIQSDGFQSVIPTANWMYPTQKKHTPHEFSNLIQPSSSYLFSSSEVASNQQHWIDEWLSASQ